jgi:hypothetical protein
MTGGVHRSSTINHPVGRVGEVPGVCYFRFRVPPGSFRSGLFTSMSEMTNHIPSVLLVGLAADNGLLSLTS